jgi:Isochorismatase family
MGFQADLSDLGAEDVPNGFLFLHLGVKDGVLARDGWGTDIVDELTPEDGQPVIYKTRFSAFYRTELDELLRSYGAKHLIITGCTTSIASSRPSVTPSSATTTASCWRTAPPNPWAITSAAATMKPRSCSSSGSSAPCRTPATSSTPSNRPELSPPRRRRRYAHADRGGKTRVQVPSLPCFTRSTDDFPPRRRSDR